MRSAIILVGGKATRADGFPKYHFKIGDKTFLEMQIQELRFCVDEICIVGRDSDQLQNIPIIPDVTYIHDIREGKGPSGGIHAGAWNVHGEFFFVTACDMPFLSCKVISFLFSQAKGFDSAVPVWDDGKYEPLCAVYSREAVRLFYDTCQYRRLSQLVEGIQTRLIPVTEIRTIDPELDIFTNINDLNSLSQLN